MSILMKVLVLILSLVAETNCHLKLFPDDFDDSSSTKYSSTIKNKLHLFPSVSFFYLFK
jgi:hypothetical protein